MTAPTAPNRAPVGALTRARRLATTPIKSGYRRWAEATAARRPLPDFLILGTKRGGTTSLFNHLLGHPGVLAPVPARQRIKHTYFFSLHHARGEAWYRSHFPTEAARREVTDRTGGSAVVGEATPYDLYHPLAPGRAAALVPEARLVALVRHPVDRAVSHHTERTRNGREDLALADAIAAEAERTAGAADALAAGRIDFHDAHRDHSYLDQGRYAQGLRRWLDHYPAEQLLVVRSEDLYADPAATLAQVCVHLGIGPPPAGIELRHHNATRRAGIDPDLRAWMWEQVADDVADLEDLLGRPLGWS